MFVQEQVLTYVQRSRQQIKPMPHETEERFVERMRRMEDCLRTQPIASNTVEIRIERAAGGLVCECRYS